MNEDNNNENDQPKEEQKPSDETQVKYREISKDELKQALEDHQKWLESDGEKGERADLSRVNLQRAYLIDANLQKAYLWGVNLQMGNLTRANLHKANLVLANLQSAIFSRANLQEADLYRGNLQKAHLYEANLQNAKLTDANLMKANFYGANLQNAMLYKSKMQKTSLEKVNGLAKANLKDANFEDASGLLGNEFAYADVTGTKLPDDIKEFRALETIKETSQNARKIFFAMLLGCVYSWLTIATTTDVRLLTNSASSPLPIIGTEIPIAWFYITAPLVLICLYFYFHLYLDNLWKGLASLPAIFPDGKPLDQRAYPWLLNTLVCRYFERLKNRPIFAYGKELITIFLAWFVTPITMIAFWLRYIPRHDWWGTCMHIGMIAFSIGFSFISFRLCTLTLQGKGETIFKIQEFWKNRRFYYDVVIVIVVVISFLLLSYGGIEAIRSEKSNFTSIKNFVPLVLNKLGYDVFADFQEKIVSEIPTNYGLIVKEERLEFVKGANLRGRNLNNADISKAFLVKADLRNAHLQNAILSKANLQQTNLAGATLRKANLEGATLQQANLMDSALQDANFRESNLQEANLRKTNGIKANFFGANLKKADLSCANLNESILGFVNFQDAFLTCASLEKAILADANLRKANLEGTNLKQANLSKANLMDAKFGKANYWHAHLHGAKSPRFLSVYPGMEVRETNFEGADLSQANFSRAILTEVKNLTIEQLSTVKTLYQAKLDPELMEQVKKCCPHLLEKPKDESDQKGETE